MKNIVCKINGPIALYVWALSVILLTVNFIQNADNIFVALLIASIISLLSYAYFLNKACHITIYENELELKYFIGLTQKVATSDIKKIVVIRGFYSLWDEDEINPENKIIPRICYDKLVLHYKNGESREIKINVIIGGVNKLIKILKNET